MVRVCVVFEGVRINRFVPFLGFVPFLTVRRTRASVVPPVV
jgi:hypothetical protein